MTERSEMEAVIEAVLFVASEPVPRSRLIDLFDEDEREEAAAALAAVLARYGVVRPAGAPLAPVAPVEGNGTAPDAETEAQEPAAVEEGGEAAGEIAPEEPSAPVAAVAQAGPDEAVAGTEPDEPASESAKPAEPAPAEMTLADLAEEPPSRAEEEEAFALAPERRGIMVEEVAGGVRLVTRPELVGWLRRFFDVSGGTKLSMAALETLAIIAYRQPITGPEIQELRSVSPAGVIKTLLERRMVRIAGRKEVVGKPFLYATTREFLIHFGLKSLKDLPPLEDFEETFGGLADGGGDFLAGGADREEQLLAEAAALEMAQADSAEAAESAEAEAIEAIRGRYEPAAWPALPDVPEPRAPSETSAAETNEAAVEDEREGEAELSIAGEEGES